MSEEFDCQTCGACCIEAGPVQVDIDDDVPRYLTRSVRGVIGFASWEADDGVRRMATHMGGRCKILKGEVGVACSCAIYARRPKVCREFLPGSKGCLASRETAAHKRTRLEFRPRGYGADWEATVNPAGGERG